MIEMLSGALTFAYFMASALFLKSWKRTHDRLFLNFAVAFCFFGANQIVSSIPMLADQALGYEYLLRVLGFVVIIAAIVEKNLGPRRPH